MHAGSHYPLGAVLRSFSYERERLPQPRIGPCQVQLDALLDSNDTVANTIMRLARDIRGRVGGRHCIDRGGLPPVACWSNSHALTKLLNSLILLLQTRRIALGVSRPRQHIFGE